MDGDNMNDMDFVNSQLGDGAADTPQGGDHVDTPPAVDGAGTGDGAASSDTGAASGNDGDNAPAQDKPGEAAQGGDGQGTTDKPAEDEEPLEDLIEDLSATAFNKKLEANPALKTALEADQATRNLVFSALRRAAKLDQYEGIFTNPETAKFTLDTANEMIEFDRLFRSEDTQDAVSFLEALRFNSWAKDEQGNVVMQDGTPVSTGAYERIMGTYRQHMWSEAAQIAQSTNDDELAEAIRIVQERLEGKPATAAATKSDAATGKEAELPDSVKASLKRLEQYEKRDRESQATSQQEFVKSVNADILTTLTGEVTKLVDNIAKRQNVTMGDYVRKNVIRDSVEGIKKTLIGNPAYKNMMNTLMQTVSRSAEGKQKVVNQAMASAKQSLAKVVAGQISAATKGTVSTAQARQDKIDKQTQHKEVNTTGGANTRQTLPDVKSLLADAAKKKGKPLTELEEVDVLLAATSGQ